MAHYIIMGRGGPLVRPSPRPVEEVAVIDAIQPRWLIVAAVAAFVIGIVGIYIGWSAWGPMALLAGEVLTILAAILLTTPNTAYVRPARDKPTAEDPNTLGSDLSTDASAREATE